MAWIGRILVILLVVLFAIPTLGIILFFVPVGLWISAIFAGVPVSLQSLVGMKLRKVRPHNIVEPLISATKAGLDLDINQMEAHYLAGGNVGRVVSAMISADKAAIDLTWQRSTAIDLAGRDVLQAVQTSVNPRVINTPRVSAVAKDGIQLIAVARVTIRANLDRLVGGAGEETILALIDEGAAVLELVLAGDEQIEVPVPVIVAPRHIAQAGAEEVGAAISSATRSRNS